jgi:hypothetical protein
LARLLDHLVVSAIDAPRRAPQQSSNYARTSFLYATRCGWSASGPFRRVRSSM